MKFNEKLREAGLDPSEVSAILHLTALEPLRSKLPLMVDQYPDLFDAYQSVHSRQAAATLSNRRFAASFVPYAPRVMIFAGLFEITGKQDLPVTEIYADPRFARLERDFGATDTAPTRNLARGGTQRKFTLFLRGELRTEIGRFMIPRPGTRAYVRIAANFDTDIMFKPGQTG
ncbi:MAG: hypothetical protein WCS20_06755 [Alphaproteobacteria bacterium]|jgi:hypothetical protein